MDILLINRAYVCEIEDAIEGGTFLKVLWVSSTVFFLEGGGVGGNFFILILRMSFDSLTSTILHPLLYVKI